MIETIKQIGECAIRKDGKVVGRGSNVGILDQGGKMDDE